MTEVKIEGTTSTGFEFEYPKANLDNMELVDLLAESEENPIVVGKIIEMLLGKELKKALYEHVREEDGRVPVEKTNSELLEIFNASDESKN